jgi:hypothetical protein
MFLLVRVGIDSKRVREAIRPIFERRATHPIPSAMPSPPEEWASPFSALASECGLNIGLLDAYHYIEQFLSGGEIL